MKAYLLAISGAIILSAVISILVSDGKMGKFIKGMTRLFVFSVLLVPLLSMFSEKKIVLTASEIAADEGYLAFCAEKLSKQDEEEIATYLVEEYSLAVQVKVERTIENGFPRKKIVIKLFENGIYGQEEHIDIVSRIQEQIQEEYGCMTEVVWQERE